MNDIYSNLSALAVFSELYDNQKDVYAILWEFTKDVINKKNFRTFTTADLKQAMTDIYGFDNIPEAVYSDMLRKQKNKTITIVSKGQGLIEYLVESQFAVELKNNNTNYEYKNRSRLFRELLDDLALFLSEEMPDSEISEEDLLVELKVYLLGDSSSGKLSEHISKFVYSLKDDDSNKTEILNQIKEGFVIYEGICWNDKLNELGNWRHPLTLYYDMDIIFYMAGYSGSIFKNIFEEMHSMIREINGAAAKKKKDRYINTKYFPDVKKQIDTYFDCAEKIVSGVWELDFRETAMHFIVSHCDTVSEVQRMRANLDYMLKSNAILEDTESTFYNNDQYSQNVESIELIEKYAANNDRDKVERCAKRISYINMLRQGRNCDKLENCKYIIVSRNKLFSTIDSDTDSKINNEFVRVISPELLTSRFWFQLNKGFGKKNFPKSLDVLAQSQIILAHNVGKNIASCYENLKKERERDSITEEQLTYQIAKLREVSVLPERVSLEVLAESYNLREAKVSDMIEQQRKEAQEKQERESYIANLEKDNRDLEDNIKNLNNLAMKEMATTQELTNRVQGLAEENERDKKEIENLKRVIQENEEEKARRDKKEDRVKLGIWVVIFVVLIVFTILFYIKEEKIATTVFTIIDTLVLLCGFIKPIFKKYVDKA